MAEPFQKLDLVGVLNGEVIDKQKPLLGICLGMQLLAQESMEDGEHEGLGWISGMVRRFNPDAPTLKVPHVEALSMNMICTK